MLLACCVTAWLSCTQTRQPCLTPKTAGLNVECVHLVTDTSTVPVDTVLQAAVFIALTDSAKVEVIDSLYNSLFTLSLSPVASSCKYMIATDTLSSSLYDTLTFFYQRNLQFLSNACGYTYFYYLDSVHTSHFNIDSVIIANASVTNNVNTEHVKIYIHPHY
jgi:hypothetical protein